MTLYLSNRNEFEFYLWSLFEYGSWNMYNLKKKWGAYTPKGVASQIERHSAKEKTSQAEEETFKVVDEMKGQN